MKNTFLTVCTTDKYLEGVLVLNESLKRTKSNYELTVLITKNTSLELENMLKNMKIRVIRLNREVNIPDEIIENNKDKGFSHWNNTLEKLFMFELDEFDKIVYLDSDMMVLENIDELFERPHMSAVVAGSLYPGNEQWVKLNSGCMVIKPQKGLLDEFINILPEVVNQREYFGDQDVLQVYYSDWEKNNMLKLDEKYNVFYGYIEYYVRNLGYKINGKNNENNIAIVHFIGETKPWMDNKAQIRRQYLSLIRNRRYISLKVLIQYRNLLKLVNKQIVKCK